MSDYCQGGCGRWLDNERYYVPVSIDEVMVVCYDCKMDMSAGEVLHEIDEYDAELMYGIDDDYYNDMEDDY